MSDGSGRVTYRITKMIKAGAVFDVIGAVLCIGGVAVMARLVG